MTTNAELVMWGIRMLRQTHLHIDPIAVASVAQLPLDTVIAEMERFEQAGLYQPYHPRWSACPTEECLLVLPIPHACTLARDAPARTRGFLESS